MRADCLCVSPAAGGTRPEASLQLGSSISRLSDIETPDFWAPTWQLDLPAKRQDLFLAIPPLR